MELSHSHQMGNQLVYVLVIHRYKSVDTYSHGGATDRYGSRMDPFQDVRKIFSELDEAGIKIAAASR